MCQYILEGAPEVAKPETKGALAWWAIHGDPFAPHVRPGDSTEQSTADFAESFGGRANLLNQLMLDPWPKSL